jgi:hypothetical protein
VYVYEYGYELVYEFEYEYGYVYVYEYEYLYIICTTVYEKIRCRSLKKHNLKFGRKKNLFSFFKRTSNGHI